MRNNLYSAYVSSIQLLEGELNIPPLDAACISSSLKAASAWDRHLIKASCVIDNCDPSTFFMNSSALRKLM